MKLRMDKGWLRVMLPLLFPRVGSFSVEEGLVSFLLSDVASDEDDILNAFFLGESVPPELLAKIPVICF